MKRILDNSNLEPKATSPINAQAIAERLTNAWGLGLMTCSEGAIIYIILYLLKLIYMFTNLKILQ